VRYDELDPPLLFVREPETVGAYEAKTRLPELLGEVEAGASYVITRHGRPIARLLPFERTADATDVIETILALRRGHTFAGSVRDAIDEGRR
jgi:prevent-host-death family protein